MTASRSAATSPALVGALLAGIGLGINWSRVPDDWAPGRILHARLFLVAAIVLGVIAAIAGRAHERARRAALMAALSMVLALLATVRQAGNQPGQQAFSVISPTAYAVVAAAVAAFMVAAARSPSDGGR